MLLNMTLSKTFCMFPRPRNINAIMEVPYNAKQIQVPVLITIKRNPIIIAIFMNTLISMFYSPPV